MYGSSDFHNKKYSKMVETLIRVAAGFAVVFIRGKHGGMKLVSMGDGLENVSSKI